MSDIKIEAVVEFNDGEALVINRKPKYLFEKIGKDLVGRDGPFARTYKYEVVNCGPKAFGGAVFDIPMRDGTYLEGDTWVDYKDDTIRANGQYWASGLKGFSSITYSTRKDLMNCYVFTGGMAEPDAVAELRAVYTGCVYPYRDYERVINYDEDRMKWFRKNSKLERDKRNLITHVKAAHKTIESLSEKGMMFV